LTRDHIIKFFIFKKINLKKKKEKKKEEKNSTTPKPPLAPKEI
jgi:hypothetical protein